MLLLSYFFFANFCLLFARFDKLFGISVFLEQLSVPVVRMLRNIVVLGKRAYLRGYYLLRDEVLLCYCDTLFNIRRQYRIQQVM